MLERTKTNVCQSESSNTNIQILYTSQTNNLAYIQTNEQSAPLRIMEHFFHPETNHMRYWLIIKISKMRTRTPEDETN
jgi:hypothetical protein